MMSTKFKCGELACFKGASFAILKYAKGSIFIWCVNAPGELNSMCLGFPSPSKPSTVSVIFEDEPADISRAFAKVVSQKLQVPVFAAIPDSFSSADMVQVESELLTALATI